MKDILKAIVLTVLMLTSTAGLFYLVVFHFKIVALVVMVLIVLFLVVSTFMGIYSAIRDN